MLALNSECQFKDIYPGAIFRRLDDGYYYIATRENLSNGFFTNAMLVDGALSSAYIGERHYIRPTEEIHYFGYLGLNWHPDEF